MPAIFQFVVLLVQIFPSALKAFQAWQDFHGAQLNRERRKKLASDINSVVQTAVSSKNTSGIEDAIKNLGRPAAKADPGSQNPS